MKTLICDSPYAAIEFPEPSVEELEAMMRDDVEVAGLPCDLDAVEPGPALAATLSAIDVETLDAHDRVTVLRAHRRMVAHFQGHVLRDMVGIHDAYQDMEQDQGCEVEAAEAAAAEVRVALALTRRGADIEMSLALELRARIPQVLDAVLAGEVDVARAKAIDRHTLDLDRTVAAGIADTVLPRAATLTVGQLSAWLQKLRMAAAPDAAQERFEAAHDERYVSVEATPEGTAHLHAFHLSPDHANAIMRRLTRDARKLRRKGEERSADQLRADVLVDLCTSPVAARGTHGNHIGVSTSRGGGVNITVDLATLARLEDMPGHLDGYGPIVADLARRIAAEQIGARWIWTVRHPDTGAALATGVMRRRPDTSVTRDVRARNPVCVFPGCRMPAADCDLDHAVAWSEGGPTTRRNLAPMCRHDHGIKHSAGWDYEILDDGTIIWATPLGHLYTVRPPP